MKGNPTRATTIVESRRGAPLGDRGVVAAQALGAALVGFGAALLAYYLFSREGLEKIKEWIPKVTITREPEIILTDVHRNGHSKAKLRGLGRL